ncbi:hypothetical protein QF001_000679 [Paraburkholderia youngii]
MRGVDFGGEARARIEVHDDVMRRERGGHLGQRCLLQLPGRILGGRARVAAHVVELDEHVLLPRPRAHRVQVQAGVGAARGLGRIGNAVVIAVGDARRHVVRSARCGKVDERPVGAGAGGGESTVEASDGLVMRIQRIERLAADVRGRGRGERRHVRADPVVSGERLGGALAEADEVHRPGRGPRRPGRLQFDEARTVAPVRQIGPGCVEEIDDLAGVVHRREFVR